MAYLPKNFNVNLNNALFIYKNIDEWGHFKKKWTKSNIFKRYLQCMLIIGKRLYVCIYKTNDVKYDDIDTLLYINSKNTFESLQFLENSRTVFIKQESRFKLIYSDKDNEIIHNIKTPIWVVLLSIINFPLFVLKYWKKALKYPELYFENYGKDYANNNELLKYPNLKRVIFANDHNVHNRLFKIVCEHKKIKTIYLQHASITRFFPALDFDQSFIFGEVDFVKYKNIGNINGEVILAGVPKFDALFPLRKLKKANNYTNIGLALNLIDESDKILMVIQRILDETNYNIIVRMHPGDKRIFKINSEMVSFHNAKDQPITEFLEKIGLLLAGESSIHLEALYYNIHSFHINLTSGVIKDHYEFLKYKLVTEFKINEISTEYIKNLIKKTNTFDKVKLFIHSYGSKHDGRVGEFIKSEIYK